MICVLKWNGGYDLHAIQAIFEPFDTCEFEFIEPRWADNFKLAVFVTGDQEQIDNLIVRLYQCLMMIEFEMTYDIHNSNFFGIPTHLLRRVNEQVDTGSAGTQTPTSASVVPCPNEPVSPSEALETINVPIANELLRKGPSGPWSFSPTTNIKPVVNDNLGDDDFHSKFESPMQEIFDCLENEKIIQSTFPGFFSFFKGNVQENACIDKIIAFMCSRFEYQVIEFQVGADLMYWANQIRSRNVKKVILKFFPIHIAKGISAQLHSEFRQVVFHLSRFKHVSRENDGTFKCIMETDNDIEFVVGKLMEI